MPSFIQLTNSSTNELMNKLITNTTYQRVLLQKLTVIYLIKTVPPFMETKGSSLRPQEPATEPCPGTDHIFLHYFFQIHFNILLPSKLKPFKSFVPFRFSEQKFVCFLNTTMHATCCGDLTLLHSMHLYKIHTPMTVSFSSIILSPQLDVLYFT